MNFDKVKIVSKKALRAAESLGNWVTLLLVMPVVRTTAFQRRRDPNSYSSIDASNLLDIVCILLLLVVCMSNMKRISKHLRTGSTNAYLFYYILCAVSIIWAVRIEWLYTPYRAVEMIVMMFA